MTSKPRLSRLRLAANVGLGLSLALALLVVFGIDRWRTVPPPPPDGDGGVVVPTNTPVQPTVPARELRLAVIPGRPAGRPEFDDMGKLLRSLGEGYKYRGLAMADLTDPAKLAEYNVLFLTCCGVPESWVEQETGEAGRTGKGTTYKKVKVKEEKYQQAADNLREWVNKGGTLYASDLHFNLVAKAFPDEVDNRQVDTGRKQDLGAEVVDPGLREILGPRIDLKFDQPDWRPAAFEGDHVTVYLQGEYENTDGEKTTAPLLVKFPVNDGLVIFTSFHNEKVNSEIEQKLLRYLVFAVVTAPIESQVLKTMIQGGFQPGQKGIFSATRGGDSVTKTYRCTKAGDLQFVLGFQGPGARLRLSVTSPEGKTFTQEGEATLTVDIPQAAAGNYQYTVTALQLPNENFAYTVTVGQK